jgi:hypothetical protein
MVLGDSISEKRYDVFLSYNSEDRDAVEQIAVYLADCTGLKPWLDKWKLIPGEDWVENLERGLRSALTCAIFVGKSGEGPWQQKELTAALNQQVKNPGFRVIPVLLPNAPTVPKLPLFLAGNTWVEFRESMDDDALWRLECGILGKAPERGRPSAPEDCLQPQAKPQPQADPADLVYPGGAMDVDSRFYIRREADDAVFGAVHRHRGMVTVRGARQSGKTSLILQAYVNTRRTSKPLRPVFVDFQALSEKDFDSLGAIWQRIAQEIDIQLGLASWKPESWEAASAYDRNLTRYLDRCVFAVDQTPLLLCLDELDRVFKLPLRSGFFPSVRAFFNRGAWDPAWRNVRWLLSTCSEPSSYIEDPTESPFNVGRKIELGSLSIDQTTDFARRHGLGLDASVIERIVDYVGGRPFLVHLLLYHLAINPQQQEQLFDVRSAGGGVFLEHLKRHQVKFREKPELREAMKHVIAGQGCDDVRLANSLEASGLVIHDASFRAICSCQLYKEYFAGVL